MKPTPILSEEIVWKLSTEAWEAVQKFVGDTVLEGIEVTERETDVILKADSPSYHVVNAVYRLRSLGKLARDPGLDLRSAFFGIQFQAGVHSYHLNLDPNYDFIIQQFIGEGITVQIGVGRVRALIRCDVDDRSVSSGWIRRPAFSDTSEESAWFREQLETQAARCATDRPDSC